MAFKVIVNRYHQRLQFEEENLKDALAYADSEECFFIGIVNPTTGECWVSRTTAIGYSDADAVADIEASTGVKPTTVIHV